MKRQFTLAFGCLAVLWLILVALMTFFVSPVQGQTENLLLNGDFEEGYTAFNGNQAVQIAAGWTPFWVTEDLDIPDNPNGARPEFMASDSPQSPFPRAFTGNKAQLWHTKFSTAFAGVSQRVPVPPESTVRMTAWTYAWSSEGNDPTTSQNGAWVRQRIGIDPFGENDPTSPNIVWSQPGQYLDTWGRISIEATSQSDHVTVFLSAYPNRHLPQNDIYFDNAELILVSFGLPEPTGGGAPLVAPTVDPLLTGLVTGQGVAPGTQGLTFSSEPAVPVIQIEPVAIESDDMDSAIAQATMNTPPDAPFWGLALFGIVFCLLIGAILLIPDKKPVPEPIPIRKTADHTDPTTPQHKA